MNILTIHGKGFPIYQKHNHLDFFPENCWELHREQQNAWYRRKRKKNKKFYREKAKVIQKK